MAFDSLGRYNPNWKSWDHIGNMIPVVEHSEGIRPQGEFRPAAWLPVQFFDKFYEDYFVIMPGKLLAFDNDGRVVPAQYGLTAATITYTTTDTAAGVIDVRTGAALVTGAEGSFAVSGVSSFMGRGEGAMSVSKPVAVAPYGFWQWAGDGSSLDDGNNPAALRHHNYELQHRVALLCDYVIELPLVPAVVTTHALTEASNNGTTHVSTLNPLTGHIPMAANTVRTPFTFAEGIGAPANVATVFAVQVDTLAEVKSAGDWYVNLNTGVISVYHVGNIGATDYTLTFYTYAAAPGTVSKFACAIGDLKAGDFVKCDANSNFVVDSSPSLDATMGQILEVENVLGKDALDRVRTAFVGLSTNAAGSLPGTAGSMDQMPGSANGGVSDKVAYAGAANLVVRINLISR